MFIPYFFAFLFLSCLLERYDAHYFDYNTFLYLCFSVFFSLFVFLSLFLYLCFSIFVSLSLFLYLCFSIFVSLSLFLYLCFSVSVSNPFFGLLLGQLKIGFAWVITASCAWTVYKKKIVKTNFSLYFSIYSERDNIFFAVYYCDIIKHLFATFGSLSKR
jgi:hypothetical protein